MSTTRKHSGYVNTGCSCQSKANVEAEVKGYAEPQYEPNPTAKDAVEEAEKYSNTEVPGYNKLFAGTLLLFTFLIVTQSSN